ncbi:SDR family NAD(P)-dependent oxidoreductase [Streptomyces sp. ActVer]|uniref:SDR family NAD(P)-dependent oxidoreductase n=1 Tax=Streptomyces sp. ActVer TaxID=3014558 RepID=UPI0022B2D972|nr:SDR family NAD(P)-dependent oxidoreductase [Streptomyces sp. ActVer]MCZ4511671.1 SDR family NAD(P)-dependent oxidoreductase [Streptomyces sp. ActVer]
MLVLLAATGITVLAIARAIARAIGSQGYDVTLIPRNRSKLDDLASTLTTEGITAAAFPADVLDRATLTQALKDATTQFGGIDVLEYTPSAGLDTTAVTADRGEVRQAVGIATSVPTTRPSNHHTRIRARHDR